MSTETGTTGTGNETAPKIVVSIAGVKADLQNGLDRKQIGEKYGLTWANQQKLFADPRLKGLKVKRQIEPSFVIAEDEEGATPAAEAAVNTTAAPAATEEAAAPVAEKAVEEKAAEEAPKAEQQAVTVTKQTGAW